MNCGLRHFGNDVMQLSYRICTSHLAGLWIGAANSNTSHSNKAGSTTVKQARLIGKGSRSTAVLSK